MTIESLFTVIPANRIEYHRNALALIPSADDPEPGVAVLIVDEQKNSRSLQCSCRASAGKKNCKHIQELSKALRQTSGLDHSGRMDEVFRSGVWYRLAMALHNTCPVSPSDIRPDSGGDAAAENGRIRLSDPSGDIHVESGLNGAPHDGEAAADAAALMLERTGIRLPDGESLHRGKVLDMLAVMTLSETEQVMHKRGIQSRRMVAEKSFWYRLAYHCRSEMAGSGVEMTMDIDADTGRFLIRCRGGEASAVDITVPRKAAMPLKKSLEKDFHNRSSLPVWSESLESIVRVYADDDNNLKLDLYLLLHLPDGSTETFERRRLSKYWYGDTVYIPEKKVLATWRTPDRLAPVFGRSYSKKIKKDRVPEVVEKIGDIFSPPNIVDPAVSRLKVHREYGRIEIDPQALDRDWCWLDLHYGFGGDVSVSLAEIYQARQSGKRYISVANGWIDTRAINIKALTDQPGETLTRQLADGNTALRLSKMEMLRMQAASGGMFQVRGETGSAEGQVMQSILEMRPPAPIGDIPGLSSTLRCYQHRGVEWLAFLHGNGLGGLLCDEMGLGKTHQVMALMSWLANEEKIDAPGIVVCPTTVISHWARKIRDHAPGLHPYVYHGTDREIPDAPKPGSVLITSYGLLYRDIETLSRIRFSVAAFDEAHHIKNPSAKSSQAAANLPADIKLAVTGTPVENRLTDLKALMDLVLPGYLGNDDTFRQRYENGHKGAVAELRRLVQPFVLRRTKAAVLDELPGKIEDIRYCRLSDAQVKLYRDAVDGRGRKLLSQLQQTDDDIPYFHIFALLTLLKQICNHPASIAKKQADLAGVPGIEPAALDSGKWELFTELADTCLENGEKIVVFTQFIPMVDMILKHFKQKGIKTASITGGTRNRGNEIDRFNTEPACRVFVGSLKAGGSGIDLTGGSVVIHYDRWWNAAKEDQATDRVHRIGQTRGVQVFKLVTEGTLEEKIAAIIDRKKNLMGDVIKDDDPNTLKTFTRDELKDLIAQPE